MTAKLAAMLALPLVLGTCRPSRAQESEQRRVVAACVTDKAGKAVPDLTAANFRGRARGQEVRVLSASLDNTSPLRIAVVVDASASMVGSWTPAWAAAAHIIDQLTPRHQLALLTLDDTIHTYSGLSSDRKALQAAVEKGRDVLPSGPSALYGGIVTLSQGLSGDGLDVIYLLTDGEDSASLATPRMAEARAGRKGVRVFVALFQEVRGGPMRRVTLSSAEHELRMVAGATGGVVLPEAQFASVRDLESFYPCMTDAYRLDIALPFGSEALLEWNLEVVVPEGKKMKNVRLLYPRHLVPSPD